MRAKKSPVSQSPRALNRKWYHLTFRGEILTKRHFFRFPVENIGGDNPFYFEYLTLLPPITYAIK